MTTPPAVLLLDDGELDRVEAILDDFGADFVRLQRREIGPSVEAPRRLLVTSGTRALKGMPRVVPPDGGDSPPPVWVCLHGQDFLPLRQRLRELGVHFLLQSALDQASLRLLLVQLLFAGEERRGGLRLPLGGEVTWCRDGERGKARLVDLTRETCRIEVTSEIAPGESIRVVFPAALGGGEEFEVWGPVTRCERGPARSGAPTSFLVVQFEEAEGAAVEQLDALVSGERIGARLSPLADLASAEPEPAALEAAVTDEERRSEQRHPYTREVHAFSSLAQTADELAFGYDLSLEGVLIKGHPGLEEGARFTLALYGGAREEPAVVDATVVRNRGEDGVAFRFDSVSDEQRRMLAKLTTGSPCIESLGRDARDDSRVVVSRLTRAGD